MNQLAEISVESKRCTKCGVEKQLTEFFARKGASDGRMSLCKECKKKAINEWRENNREKWNAYTREKGKTEHHREKRKERESSPAGVGKRREHDRRRRDSPEFREKRASYERRDYVVA